VLKVRIIPTLLYKEKGLVKGVKFDAWRRIGSAQQSVRLFNMREVDELVFLDIAASVAGRGPDFELVDELADECFMPLCVGGGIRTVEDVRQLLAVGADKVCINSAAIAAPELITKAADLFGSQCVVVSIDFRRGPDGDTEVYSHSGTRPCGRDVIAWAREVEERGAGEILVTSIDLDGTMSGYDLDVVSGVCDAVSIPVIASGGAGSYDHFLAASRAGASGLAAASIYQFTEMTPSEAKTYLGAHGVAVRV
jgi:imidazole glycerol-phosphate synthase subunit HisF